MPTSPFFEAANAGGDQAVLVTEFVPGRRPQGNGRTYAILGALVGRLHARRGETLPSGAAWHHLTLDGTPEAFVHPDFVPSMPSPP